MGEFFFQSRLCAFSALVLQSTVVLLLLTQSNGVDSQGVGPSQTITALVDEDVVLPCHLEPAVDAVSESVEWARHDLEPRFVHVWRDGQNLLENQNPSYKGRTSLSVDNLKHGDFSLKLCAVKLSDNGVYTCYFPSQNQKFSVKLIVDVSCLPLWEVMLISSACGLLCGIVSLGGSLFFWTTAKSEILSSISLVKKDGKDDELQKLSTKVKEELTACTEDLSQVKELKSGTERLISEYKSQLFEIEKKRERNEEMVKEVEVKIEYSEKQNATYITERLLKEQQSLLEAQGELEKIKNELEEKKLQTEKLLQKTDKVDKAMTERHDRLKTLIDGITSLLGGAENQDKRSPLSTGKS